MRPKLLFIKALSPFLSINGSHEERMNTPSPRVNTPSPNPLKIEANQAKIEEEPITPEILVARNEMRAKNENDLEVTDVESGLSIQDENIENIDETFSMEEDIETPVPILTRDKLVRFVFFLTLYLVIGSIPPG